MMLELKSKGIMPSKVHFKFKSPATKLEKLTHPKLWLGSNHHTYYNTTTTNPYPHVLTGTTNGRLPLVGLTFSPLTTNN